MFRKLKDIQLAQLFISTENLISALEKLTLKMIMKLQPEVKFSFRKTGQKLTIETESLIKVSKMTKKEIRIWKKWKQKKLLQFKNQRQRKKLLQKRLK